LAIFIAEFFFKKKYVTQRYDDDKYKILYDSSNNLIKSTYDFIRGFLKNILKMEIV